MKTLDVLLKEWNAITAANAELVSKWQAAGKPESGRARLLAASQKWQKAKDAYMRAAKRNATR